MTGLSIVVPVYRVERTLARCVQSIVDQKVADCEVILVDDGSPDGCPAMCDDWARRYDCICVIHKENGGLSDARNAGIEAATKDYVTFVDSDDFLAPGTLAPLLALLAEHADYDIVEYPICMDRGGDDQSVTTFRPQAYTDRKRYWLAEQAYKHTYACNKVFRRTLFGDVRFPVGRAFEDIATLPALLERARTVAVTDIGMYHYCVNPDGITMTAGGREWEQLLDAHLQVVGHMGMESVEEQVYYMTVVNIQLQTYKLTHRPPRLETRHVSRWWRMETPVMCAKAACLNIIGMKALCRLVNALAPNRNYR